jgi:hypothetical protein
VETWHRLVSVERPRLLGLYHAEFGRLEKERQQLALEASELFRRVELLSIKADRGEKLTAKIVQLVNAVVDAEFARLRSRMRGAGMASEVPSADAQASKEMDGELVKMYRILAKQLHPDANGSTQTAESWHQVQRAYAERDGARLHSLLSVIDPGRVPSAAGEEWTLERWREEESRLAARRRLEARKLDRLRREEPFVLAEQLDDERWVQSHRADLERDIAARKAEIIENRRLYARLTSGLGVDPNPGGSGEDNAGFDQEFFDNTYFGGR